ncbi:hypothetical protein MHU86_13291 [Fragilaria crotonensis]|nr:hypothetical protein MHU86_13291 [Fragilaria crotonensis]
MPWQVVPSLLIIMGAFNLTAAGIWAVDRVYYGKRGRPILRDRFEYALENRNYEVLKFREKLAKAAAAAEKEAAAAKK